MAGKETTIMSDFFRFPHTPHLAWLGEGTPRDDKVLSLAEADVFLVGEVVVEEKLDGANMGISFCPDGDVRVQNRGQFLQLPMRGQFEKLHGWLRPRVDLLFDALGEDLILFGEWCAARHSIDYERLPDWYVVFDVYDRKKRRFWSTTRRNVLATQLDFTFVPKLHQGHISLKSLKDFVQTQSSAYRNGSLEGVVVRRESADWLESRAKLVRPDFVQSIGEHWSQRRIEWNGLFSRKEIYSTSIFDGTASRSAGS
jgi:ATP-dependent RNA circularization protein (DNA/RNA ligase family)